MTTSEKYKLIKVDRLSPGKVADLIKSTDIIVLDVRPQNYSRNNYFLKNSIHIPLLYLEEMISQLPKDKPILITDWAMKQSPIAAKSLISQGYAVVGVLKGGIERWTQENRPSTQKEIKQFDVDGNSRFP